MKKKRVYTEFSVFKGHVDLLEKEGIVIKSKILGYQRKLPEVLEEHGEIFFKGKTSFTTSRIDGVNYCVASGQFTIHLRESGVSDEEYAEICGIPVYFGYRGNFHSGSDGIKKFLCNRDNGDAIYYAYRSVMAGVTGSTERVMFYYGLPEDMAEKIHLRHFEKRSASKLGENNCSFGKKGLNANCYKPFKDMENPKEAIVAIQRSGVEVACLKWADENDVDGTIEEIKFKYYSEIFKKIHREKGLEYMQQNGLKSLEEGVYSWNRDKSWKHFHYEDFMDSFKVHVMESGDKDLQSRFFACLNSGDFEGAYKEAIVCVLTLNGTISSPLHMKYKKILPNGRQVFLKSRLECGVLHMLLKSNEIEYFDYENVRIPYEMNGKNRLYYVDFFVKMKSGETILVEVKPHILCILPEGEILFKKEAAEAFSSREEMTSYIFITEKDLKNGTIESRLLGCRGKRPEGV